MRRSISCEQPQEWRLSAPLLLSPKRQRGSCRSLARASGSSAPSGRGETSLCWLCEKIRLLNLLPHAVAGVLHAGQERPDAVGEHLAHVHVAQVAVEPPELALRRRAHAAAVAGDRPQ